MRIIGGKFKGRKFNPPADKWPTRPTTDFAREALFNILNNRFYWEDIRALDLFGGAGGHCFELISRGTTDVTYVEKYYPCVKFVQATIKEMGEEDKLKIIRGDVFRFLKSCDTPFDYIFADPPYQLPTLDLLPDLIFNQHLLSPEGIFVLEHGSQHTFQNHPYFSEERKYGNTIFSFFEQPEEHEK